MIRVRTASRLHFGLLSVPGAQTSAWPNQDGEATIPRRRFGGVGLMVEQPGICLCVEPADAWCAEGPLAERALTFAKRYGESVGNRQPFHLRIETAAPEHTGLGTGTQLGLAVARAMAHLTAGGSDVVDAAKLAAHVGRGVRSSLGIHGFQHGGFLVEGGKSHDVEIAPLLCRQPFPDDWHVVLVTLPGLVGAHGPCEIDAFVRLAQHANDDRGTDALCRIVLLGMLPALAERDLRTFGEAVYDFNRRVGSLFQASQGGIYAHPQIEAIVQTIRAAGIHAVGQSSWGPTVFAIAPAPQAIELRSWLARQLGIDAGAMILTRACNHGATASG